MTKQNMIAYDHGEALIPPAIYLGMDEGETLTVTKEGEIWTAHVSRGPGEKITHNCLGCALLVLGSILSREYALPECADCARRHGREVSPIATVEPKVGGQVVWYLNHGLGKWTLTKIPQGWDVCLFPDLKPPIKSEERLKSSLYLVTMEICTRLGEKVIQWHYEAQVKDGDVFTPLG